MEYYCVMVLTGEEKSFCNAAKTALKESFPDTEFFSFERRLFTPRRGWFEAPLFSGYVFFYTQTLTHELFAELRKIKGFCHILRDNQNPEKITGHSLDELKLFIRNGEHWVQFLPGQKIKAVSGPLMGLDGDIVAVNKKKKQITVQSTLTTDGKRFDLLYEDAEVFG